LHLYEPQPYSHLRIGLRYRISFGDLSYCYLTQEHFTSGDYTRDETYAHHYVIGGKNDEGRVALYYFDLVNSEPLSITSLEEGVIAWLKSETEKLANLWEAQGWSRTDLQVYPDVPDPAKEDAYIVLLQADDPTKIIDSSVPQTYMDHLRQSASDNATSIWAKERVRIQSASNIGIRHETVKDESRIISETIYLIDDVNDSSTKTKHDSIYITQFHDGTEFYYGRFAGVHQAIGLTANLPDTSSHPTDPSAYYLYHKAEALNNRIEAVGWRLSEKTSDEYTNEAGETVKETGYSYTKNDTKTQA